MIFIKYAIVPKTSRASSSAHLISQCEAFAVSDYFSPRLIGGSPDRTEGNPHRFRHNSRRSV
jgi:hypothetical protein